VSVAFKSPAVSILIANFNGARYLETAVDSALRQTLTDIEVIIIDDASTDDSLKVALQCAAKDTRVHVLQLATNAGPAGARNAGLRVARGEWVAILDSDDFMHPERMERLLTEAERADAEICADDLLVFGSGRRSDSLLSKRQRQLQWVTFPEFVLSNRIFSNEPALGYLKPLIRRSFFQEHGLVYDTSLTIGEDYDLIARALALGARFRLLDSIGYFYRKHEQSTSHRLSSNDLAQMLVADERLLANVAKPSRELLSAFDLRTASINRAMQFNRLVTLMKASAWREAVRLAVDNPSIIRLLAMPIGARLSRMLKPRKREAVLSKQACVISRQRLVGATNGSSAYLLGICNALRADGYRVTLVAPNPATFGRWPFLRMSPEMDAFAEIHMRGAWKIGAHLWVAKNPKIAFSAAKAVLARLAARAGIDLKNWDKPAAYAVGMPWQREEFLYVSRHAPRSSLVVADYAFTTPAIPFASHGDARSLVVMHDLLSTRAGRFRDQGLIDSVVTLKEADEHALLAQADAIIAIQDVEAKKIAAALPKHPVLLTPIAYDLAAAPQPGDSRSILFVGSNTAPNIIGLQWFLDRNWPLILSRIPDCELLVAGSVASGFSRAAEQVRFLGMVPDLAPLYAKAGVVISPLTVGSGLKIKVIEALAHGKAIVATTVSVEGVDAEVLSAMSVTDDPERFADAVSNFLSDDEFRRLKAAQALEASRRNYSQESSYGELLSYLNRENGAMSKTEPAADSAKQKVSQAL
jgi:glycosyltransferase involved in cell wall biosynthesis